MTSTNVEKAVTKGKEMDTKENIYSGADFKANGSTWQEIKL
jgi:hypothetical protein